MSSTGYIVTDPEKAADKAQLDYAASSSDLTESSEATNFEFTVEEERVIVRKMDKRVLLITTLLFMFSFLDRANIGNANLAGMSTDLGLSSSQYQWLLTIFYIGYITAQPSTLLWKVVPPHIFVTCLTLIWSAVSLLQATTQTFAGMMVLRLILGMAETAYGPGTPYYYSFFYKKNEIGLRQGLFLGAAPIATAWAGTLAFAITSIKKSSLQSWRILFLVEGSPALLLVPVAYFLLPDKASSASFLTEREKKITLARGVREGNSGSEVGLDWSKVGDGLKDVKSWIQALMYFGCNASYSSLPVFLPTILAEMGFTSVHSQGISAPPYLLSFFVLVAASYYSDRIGDRSVFIIPLATIGGVGYLILALVQSTAVRYFAVFLCSCSIFPVIALILPWVSNMHESDSSRGAGFMLLNLIGQTSPLLGTRLYPAADGPYYVKGTAVCSGFMFFVAFLALLLRLILIRENKAKDELHGQVDHGRVISNIEEKVNSSGPLSSFRYTL